MGEQRTVPEYIYLDRRRLFHEGIENICGGDPDTDEIWYPSHPFYNDDRWIAYHPDCSMMEWEVIWEAK